MDARSQAAGVPPQGGGAGPSAGEVDCRDRPRPGDRGVVQRRWLEQDDIDTGRIEGTSTDERAELVRLRRENRVQAMEIEILKRASAYFAREAFPGPK